MIKKYFIFPILILFLSCQKKDCDFTFYKWNIRESYYLKFNSSDTLYLINTDPFEEQTSYTILNNEEKERIQSNLNNLSFPKEKDFSSSGEDGQVYAFYLKIDKQYQQLKIHGHQRPNQFWLFGKRLETIKDQHAFIKINKTFDLTNFNTQLIKPAPKPILASPLLKQKTTINK
jgi:hypothetical protein